MAIATTKATNADLTKYNEKGAYLTEKVTHVYTGGTIGDIVQMVEIPNRTTILAAYVSIGTAETAANATCGVTGAGTALGSFTGGATGGDINRGDETKLPYRVSFSVSNTSQTTYFIVMPSSGTWTTTATIGVQLLLASVLQA